jgi:Asp/Glu/hydantoin racemase
MSSLNSADFLDFPSVTGSSVREIKVLLINPNGTSSMTLACLRSLQPTLPPYCTVAGFTTPRPTPSAIEGHLDGVLSAAAALRAVIPVASQYDAFLVACFSAHPLINALREELTGPVIGIMEASLYSARMLGGRLGVVATGSRSKIMHEDAIRNYGLEGFSVGCETTNLAVLELETLPRDKVLDLVGEAARRLVQEKGADCIALGCAGMTEMKIRCEETVGAKDAVAQVIDGVGVGIQILIGLVREGHVTAKGGMFRSSAESRIARGQDWL